MSTYVFGGNPVQPSSVDYHFYDGFTSPLQLVWPSSFVDTETTQATVMQFNAQGAGKSVYMPQANQVGKGTSCIAYNMGTDPIDFYDFNGDTLLFTIDAGIAQWICVSGNDDEQGEWLTFVYGAGTSSADAGSLAGFGLISLPVTGEVNTLNTQFQGVEAISSPNTISADNRAQLVVVIPGGEIINLPGDMLNGFFFLLYNASGVIVTVNAPPGGSINGESSITLIPGRSCIVCYTIIDKYYTIGLESTEAQTLSLLTLPVTGSSIDLTQQQLLNNIIVFTGTLAFPCTVYFNSANPDQWTIHNQTDGDDLTLQFGSTVSPLGNIIEINQDSVIEIYSNPDNESLYIVSEVYPISETAYTPLVSGVNDKPVYFGSLVAFSQGESASGSLAIPAGGAPTVISSIDFTSTLADNSLIQVTFSLSLGLPEASTGFLSLYLKVNNADTTIFGTNPVAVLPLSILGSNSSIYPCTFTFPDDPSSHPDDTYDYEVVAVNSDATNACYINRTVSGTVTSVSSAFAIQLMNPNT